MVVLVVTFAAVGPAAASIYDAPPDSECYHPAYPTIPDRAHPVPGVVWRCICRGPSDDDCRWELRNENPAQGARSEGYVYTSSTYGCLYSINVLVSQYFGGPTNAGAGAGLGEYYPCDLRQPKRLSAGYYRDQAVLEYYNPSTGRWYACTPLGYQYNSFYTSEIGNFRDMFSVPDCGNFSYRLSNTVHFYLGGAWRGGTIWAPSLYMN
jgi:hypothetical protein